MAQRILAIGIVLLLFSPVAMAQQQNPAPAPQPDTAAAPQPGAAAAPQQATKGACVADIKEKCVGVEPGQGRIGACIKEHLAELSQPCQARLANSPTPKCVGRSQRLHRAVRERPLWLRSCITLGELCKGLSKTVAGRAEAAPL